MDFFLLLPSVAVAVIVTVLPLPAFFVVTVPLLLTVAHLVFEDFHESFMFVVFRPFLPPVVLMSVLSVIFLPAFTFGFFALKLILVTAFFMILILKDAFWLLPSLANAVIVTVLPLPAFLVVTTPLSLTVAHFSLEDFQVKLLLVAFWGSTKALRLIFFVAAIFADLPLVMATFVTLIVGGAGVCGSLGSSETGGFVMPGT